MVTHVLEVLTYEDNVQIIAGVDTETEAKLLKTDDQVSTHDFEVLTHRDSMYQLKYEGMKCRHICLKYRHM